MAKKSKRSKAKAPKRRPSKAVALVQPLRLRKEHMAQIDALVAQRFDALVNARMAAEAAAPLPTGKALIARMRSDDAAAATAIACRPENSIPAMVAEQTRELRGRIMQLESDKSVLSGRIGRLENPNLPKDGERGSGTGVYPRSRKANQPEIAGRPGTIREAAAEMLNGERAREVLPSELEARSVAQDARRELTHDHHSGLNPRREPRMLRDSRTGRTEFVDPPLPNACCEGPMPPADPYLQTR